MDDLDAIKARDDHRDRYGTLPIDGADAVADRHDLLVEIDRLKKELAEVQASFDLRWKADQRAIKMWHDAGGHELTWPDHADLCVWLLEQLGVIKEDA